MSAQDFTALCKIVVVVEYYQHLLHFRSCVLMILQCGHFAMLHYARMYLVALVAFACWHTYIAQPCCMEW